MIYPRRCPVCDRAVKPFGSLICDTCKEKLGYIREPYCLKCGKQLEDEQACYCGDCMTHGHLFDEGRALFAYKGMSDSIYRFKYRGRQEYAAFYAACMAWRLGCAHRGGGNCSGADSCGQTADPGI